MKLALAFAFAVVAGAPSAEEARIAAARADYPSAQGRLEAARVELAKQPRTAARRSAARALLMHAIADELVPAWLGTPWAYSGTSEVPGEGAIACGYLVTTVLRDAGYQVPRVLLAQQASERIVKSVALDGVILRFSDRPAADVVRAVKARGDGVWIVGLDLHAGLLVVQGGRADFCHSSVLGEARTVCEPAEESAGFESRYRVLGEVFGKTSLDRWVEGARFPLRS